MESDYAYNRHVSRLRHLSLGVRIWINNRSWNVINVSWRSAYCFILQLLVDSVATL